MKRGTKIETARLRFRSWRAGDADRLGQACNTPAVMRWLGGVQSRAQLNADVRYFTASEVRRGITYWVIERGCDGAFLGFCGLVRIPDRDCNFAGVLEIGWRLRENVWRQGFGFEAASAVLEFAFDELSADAVFSRTAAGNTASRRLMTKLGLRRRPALDYVPDGESSRLLVYAITTSIWRSHVTDADR